MNKRIRELLKQASKLANTEDTKDFDRNFDMIVAEKFAELILIEVTDILSTYRGKMVFEDGAEYNCQHPIIAIRKHFGVEE